MRSIFSSGLILFLLSVGCNTFAQQRNLISGNFSGIGFDKFVSAIEAQTDYHFYYDASYTDSITVNVVVENKTINKVLDEVFIGTNFHYAVDESNNIYITHGREILNRLPTGFFGRDSSATIETLKFDYSAYEKRELQSKLAENKVHVISLQ